MTFYDYNVPEWQEKEIDLWIKSYPPSYNYLLSLFKALKYNYRKPFLYRDNILKTTHSETNPYQFQDIIKRLVTTMEAEQRQRIVDETKKELNKDFISRVIKTTVEETKVDINNAVDFGFDYILIGAGVLLALYVLKG